MSDNLLLYFGIILVFMWLARGLIRSSMGFGLFMVWNMFLAIVPFLLISIVVNFYPNSWIIGGSLVVLWLLFLPNAYYLLTDLMHLNQNVLVNKRDNKFSPSLKYTRGDALYTFDSFLLFLTVCFGGVMGAISLRLFYDLLIENAVIGSKLVLCVVLIASGIGVYIGRYSRWNSWDAIMKPKRVLVDLYRIITNNKTLKDFMIVTLTIVAFEIFSLIVVVNYQ